MRASLIVLVVFAGCSHDEERLKATQKLRQDDVVELNATAQTTTGGNAFRLDGRFGEDLVVTNPACDLAFLNELVHAPAFKVRLKISDFRSVRCEGGIKVTPPWD